MVGKEKIKDLTAKVFLNGEFKGTAFLLSKNTALTARHVVNMNGTFEISLPNLNIEGVKVDKVILSEIEHLDIAILEFKLIEERDIQFPKIYSVLPEISNPLSYTSYGFPKSRSEGFSFDGKIRDTYKKYTQINLKLSTDGLINYEGASGSPLCIENEIYGLIIEQDTGYELGAISFSECTEFLRDNNISYEKHEPLSKSEENILNKMINLGRIGFDENEDLPYIETKAIMRNISDLDEKKNIYKSGNIDNLTDIIKKFFEQEYENSRDKILYVVSDFGKGKSVFLRHEAEKYAKNFKENRTGFFPIYFNLRDYSSYDEFKNNINIKSGCIGEYLRVEHKIEVENDLIKEKKILLLVDSLDECGYLNESDIENVMKSVKKITNYLVDVNIIVTTRPIPNILKSLIMKNEPHNDTWEFASVYGFTPEQFEEYMYILRDKITKSSSYIYNKKLIATIMNKQNIYRDFSEILSEDELKRPIIAYMLFKLLEQDYEIQKDSKLEVFLSFINMLTKDAKHINDKKYRDAVYIDNLSYRNILYVTAVMWMKDRHNGGLGLLSLDDLKEIVGDESELIQFMSHSYLRNSDGKYYFNHQSFAEIILAEYYLRVFVWSFMEKKSVQDTMAFLNIGDPTYQTMIFCKGLIELFINATYNLENNNKEELNRIRKSIFPLITSLGVEKFNNKILNDKEFNMYSESINTVFDIDKLSNRTEIPNEIIYNWPIIDIKNIMNICIEIINQDESILFFKPELSEILFGEVYKIKRRTQEFNMDISKWIATLILGVFNTCNISIDLNLANIKAENFIEMMKLNQLESNRACPDWIDILPELRFDLNEKYNLSGLSIINTTLKNWDLCCFMDGISFEKTIIENLKLYKTSFRGAEFNSVVARDVEIHGYDGEGSKFIGGSYFENFAIRSCSMRGAFIHESVILNGSFEDVDFSGAKLTAIWLIDIEKFDRVNLSGAKLSIHTDKNSRRKLKKKIPSYMHEYIKTMTDTEVEDIKSREYERLQRSILRL